MVLVQHGGHLSFVMPSKRKTNEKRPGHSRRDKINAIARLEAGDTIAAVARDMGVSRKQISSWRDVLVRARPDAFPVLSGQTTVAEQDALAAASVAERIIAKEEKVRELILDQLVAKLPNQGGVKDLLVGYGILTDKANVRAGKPTSIQGTAMAIPEDASPQDMEAVAEELRRRRLAVPARDKESLVK